jgi:hypothetical protein
MHLYLLLAHVCTKKVTQSNVAAVVLTTCVSVGRAACICCPAVSTRHAASRHRQRRPCSSIIHTPAQTHKTSCTARCHVFCTCCLLSSHTTRSVDWLLYTWAVCADRALHTLAIGPAGACKERAVASAPGYPCYTNAQYTTTKTRFVETWRWM